VVITWLDVIQFTFIFIAAGASAIAARLAHSNSNVLNGSGLMNAGVTPVSMVERIPISVGLLGTSSSSEVAATILPWLPCTYLPNWSQNQGVLPDGVPDPEHFNDCGETCVSMVVAGVWGCPVEPGAIRQWLHGPSGTGLTSPSDLVAMLKHWSVRSHVEQVSGINAFKRVAAVVNGHRPVIMLGSWEGLGTALHWMIAVGNGNETLQYIDPWDGARDYITKANWLSLEDGQLVVLDSHLHFDCRSWPNPS
jgi:hypothetical protein